MGKAALAGLPGVKQVSSGFMKGREINSIVYDSGLITPDEMISALKKARTYRGQAEIHNEH